MATEGSNPAAASIGTPVPGNKRLTPQYLYDNFVQKLKSSKVQMMKLYAMQPCWNAEMWTACLRKNEYKRDVIVDDFL